MFENYDLTASGGQFGFSISIWDTSGLEQYDGQRALSYPNSHVVCICFAIDSPDSLENVRHKASPV